MTGPRWLRRLVGPVPGSAIPLPPPALIRAVGGDFEKTGAEFLRHFRALGGLEAGEDVLEVGCGCGRMAVPLTEYLGPDGSYDGFDVQRRAVRWCREQITPRFPRFRFAHADVYSRHYNPNGRLRGREYAFPYADASFDFVFLTSVFTHMLRDDVEHYLSEIARVLRPSGRCLLTYFLLDEESRYLIGLGRSDVDFRYHVDGAAVWVEEDPEAAVAYPTDDVLGSLERHGLALEGPIHHGTWSGRDGGASYQDILVTRRRHG